MEFLLGSRVTLIAILVSASLVSLSTAYSADFEYCNKKAKYAVKVNGIEISPYPIERGEPATFNISATSGAAIPKGKLVIDVTYFIFHVYQETYDLCIETSCPVSSGDFLLTHQETLPSYTPPGSYTLTMKMLGEDGKQLTCFTFGFSIGFGKPVVADI